MKSKQKSESPVGNNDAAVKEEADTEVDEILDAQDAAEAERILADPNLKIVPFNAADYE